MLKRILVDIGIHVFTLYEIPHTEAINRVNRYSHKNAKVFTHDHN